MAITLVTTATPFAAMLDEVVYWVSMDQVGITKHETLFTLGFGPCMVLVVHHPALRAGGLAHLSMPFHRVNETDGTYLRDHVSQILERIGARPNSSFDIALFEGLWGGSAEVLEVLNGTFISCNIVDRRIRVGLVDGVVLYDPQTGNTAYYKDSANAALAKSTPYAGALIAREMVSPYPVWQPDEDAKVCNGRKEGKACGAEFGFFTRRHHCRRCGLIFCSDCSSKTKLVTYPAAENQKKLSQSIDKLLRVCDRCHAAAGSGRVVA